MSHGLFVIGIVKNAYSLKDTQWIGKQSPQLTMSIGSQSTQRAQTTIYKNGGTSVVWNQTLHIQVLHTHTVPHVLFEVQSGSKLIGSCRVPMSDIGEPKDFPLQLKDMKGKYAGTVNVTLQLYNGDINAALHAMKQQQAALAQRKQQSSAIGGFAQPGQSGGACGGGFSQPTHAVGGFVQPGSSGGGFSQPVQQHSVAGGFQQPSTAPPQRPIGGFTVSGSQNVGGVSRSTDQAGFSVPTTVPANSQGFQGYHQQENITQRTDYIPQAGASVDGRSAYPLHAPPPVYTPRAVYNAPQFPQPSAPVAGAGKYEEEEMPTAILVSSSSMQELPSPPQQHQSSLPLGWEERYDPATSRSYFVNCKTQVSQWERPM